MDPSTRGFEKTAGARVRDKLKLIGVALLVLGVSVPLATVAAAYEINPWFFVLWNSILFLPAVGWGFRPFWKNPKLAAFLIAWMVFHGVMVAALMRWVAVQYWLLLLFLELFVGYGVIYWLFGVSIERREHE